MQTFANTANTRNMHCQICFITATSPLSSAFKGTATLPPQKFQCRPPFYPTPRRRARLPPNKVLIARTQTETDLEENVLESLRSLQQSVGDVGLHRYKRLQPEKFAVTETAVRTLEQSTGGFGGGGSKLRTLLPGNWELVLTDSVAVEKNAGSITGLGSLPGAKCKKVTVELDRDGAARTVEGIEVFAGLMKGENALIGKWKVTGKGGRMLEVTYARALLMGKAKVRADSKAVLETTYCSERMRVGRSKGGDFYFFLRKQEV